MPEIKALITSAEKAKAANQSEFLRIRYSHNNTEKDSVFFEPLDPALILGKVCKIDLQESVYKGKASDKIGSIETTDDDPSSYVRKTSIDIDAALRDMRGLVAEDGELLPIMDKAIFKNQGVLSRFRQWPAANEVHHAFLGGLLEHTHCMCRIAKAVASDDVGARGIDMGVVFSAVILHDVGKIIELDFKPGTSPSRSVAGTLLGHISIADELLCKICGELQMPTRAGRVLNLRHCILSHHGKKEWGSPVEPATREAVLVHQLDMVQSRNEMAKETLAGVEPGQRSAYNKQMKTEMVNMLPAKA